MIIKYIYIYNIISNSNVIIIIIKKILLKFDIYVNSHYNKHKYGIITLSIEELIYVYTSTYIHIGI